MGVDFSGRKTGNTTEYTMAVLRGDVLELKPYQPLPKTLPATHNKLIEVLKKLLPDAVVALDFPFSVPWPFARELASMKQEKIPSEMPDLWSIVDQMPYKEFDYLRTSFVHRHGDMHRRGDVSLDVPLPVSVFLPYLKTGATDQHYSKLFQESCFVLSDGLLPVTKGRARPMAQTRRMYATKYWRG